MTVDWSWRSLSSLGIVLVLVGPAVAAAPSLTLRDAPGVSASLDSGEGRCPPEVGLTIKGRTPDDFAPGSRILPKIMAWAQTNLSASCPLVTTIRATGFVADRVVYSGIASKGDDWVLVQRPPDGIDSAPMQATKPKESAAAGAILAASSGPVEPVAKPGVDETGKKSASTAIAQCDRLAAHPDDPEAVAIGVPDAKLNVKSVIKACEPAVREDPTTPRLAFQLARGYLRANRFEDAVEQLLVAADQDHGGALAYIADFHLEGAPGIEADPALARALFERAAASGFLPARDVLSQFEDYTDRLAAAEAEETRLASAAPATANAKAAASAKYNMPQLVEGIYSGDLDGIPYNEKYVKAYLYNMAENISEVCEAHFTKREIAQLKLDAATTSLDMSAAGGVQSLVGVLMNMGQALQNPQQYVARQGQAGIDKNLLPEEAMKDAFTLMNKVSCKTRGMEQFSRNAVAFIRNEGAPRVSADDMLRTCRRDIGIANPKDANNFCMCFLGSASVAPVSRGQRKLMSTNFKAAVNAILAADSQSYQMCRR